MATTYYVKNGGNDALSGLDDANAWETLTKCATKGSNNSFLLKRGSTWTAEALSLAGKNNLIISAYGEGDKPVIDCNSSVNDGIYLYGNDIECSNIKVINALRYGIHFGTYSFAHTGFLIYNCEVSYCASSGIRVNGSDSVIHDNVTTYNGSGDSPGIQIGNGVGIGGNNIIYNNISSYNFGSGYEINWGSTDNYFYNNYGTDNQDQFLEIWDGSNNNIVEKNIGINSGGRGIKITGSSDNIIRNNLLVTFTLSGIEIGKTETQEISQRNLIYNNTIIGDGTWTGGMGTRDGSINNIFKNNIVYTTTELAVRIITVGNTLDNNCYYTASGNMIEYDGTDYTMAQFSDYQTGSGQDANSITTDPLFRSATDYRLQKNSPAIDAGVNLPEVTDDYDGNPRPLGGSYEIGAYEYYKAKIRNATLKDCTI